MAVQHKLPEYAKKRLSGFEWVPKLFGSTASRTNQCKVQGWPWRGSRGAEPLVLALLDGRYVDQTKSSPTGELTNPAS